MSRIIEVPPQVSETQAYNHGKRWTSDDELLLSRMFLKGTSIHSLCLALGRQPTGILPRLHALGLVEFNGQDYMHRSFAEDHHCPTSSTQPKDIAMTKLIDSKTFILGRDAHAMTDSEIFKLIAKTENELTALKAIKTPSKKLQAHINKTEADLKQLAEHVDSRPDTPDV